MKDITEILKGILEGCVLEIINQEETYGYEITRRLNQLGFTEVVEGTVYTILVRLEKRYENELERTLINARMSKETLDVLLTVMQENLRLIFKRR